MNLISTIINYGATRSSKGSGPARRNPGSPRGRSTSTQRRRAKWAENGLCLQCGGERPCTRCAARRRSKAKRR